MLVVRVADILAQEAHEAQLRGVVGAPLVIFRRFLEGELCVGAQVGQPGTLLVACQLVLGRAELFVDYAYAFVYELGRAACHLVLVLVGVGIIECHQCLEEILAAAYVGIVERQADD